jgi:hypothetical protein
MPAEENVAAIAAEMEDAKTFHMLCQDRPDIALRKISVLERRIPEMGKNPAILFFRAVALANRSLELYARGDKITDAQGLEECGLALKGLTRALDILQAERVGTLGKDMRPLIDKMAVALEKSAPGSVQELTGATELKFIALANRLKAPVNPDPERNLSEDELREVMETPVKAPFIIRSALVARVIAKSSSKSVVVMLYDEEEMWEHTGKLRPSNGMLEFTRPAPGIGWTWHLTASGSA